MPAKKLKREDAAMAIVPAEAGTSVNLNSEHFNELRDAYNTIMGHQLFAGIHKLKPLHINAGGHTGAFKRQDFDLAMEQKGTYISGANLLWLNLWWSATPGMPLSRSGIRALRQRWFQEARDTFPFQVVIAVTEEHSPRNDDCHGHLKLMSPEEPIHALLLSVAQDIRDGKDDATLNLWKTCILTCCAEFKKCANDGDIFCGAQNLRQKIGTEFDSMYLSPVQSMFVIMHFRETFGKTLSAKALSAEYNKKINTSQMGDPVSDTFVDTVATVWDRVFSNAVCREVIMWAEETWRKRSPYNSIYKIEAYCRKAGRDVSRLQWCLKHMNDMVMRNFIDPNVSLAQLTGKGIRGSGGKGIIDLILAKYDALHEFLGPVLRSLPFAEPDRAEIIKATESHEAMQVLFPRDSHDLTWTSCMRPAVVAMIKLVHEVVYDVDMDHCLKQGVKCGKAIADILGHESITTRLDEVRTTLAQTAAPTTTPEHGQPDGEKLAASSVSMEMAEYLSTWSISLGANATAGLAEDMPQDVLTDMYDRCKQALSQVSDSYIVEDAQRKAMQLAEEGVRLIPEPRTMQELTTSLADSFLLKQVRGTILVIYDSKQAGESLHNPLNNMVRFRTQHCKKLVGAVLAARNEKGTDFTEIDPDLTFALFDGGRAGLEQGLLSAFTSSDNTPLEKSKKTLNLVYSEASLNSRRLQIRGYITLNQIERVHMVNSPASPCLKLAKRENKVFHGTTAGDVLYPVDYPAVADAWHTTLAIKKQVYGPNRLPATGYDSDHKLLKDVEEVGSKVKRTDFSKEPVTFFACSEEVFSELMHRTNAAAVIHLTPTDHACAVAALNAKKPYLAVTMTADHSKILLRRIAQWIFEQTSTESNSMTGWYDAELATVMKKVSGGSPEKPKAKSKPKPEPKPEPKPAPPKRGSPENGAGAPEKKPKAGGSALAAIQAALAAGVGEGGIPAGGSSADGVANCEA